MSRFSYWKLRILLAVFLLSGGFLLFSGVRPVLANATDTNTFLKPANGTLQSSDWNGLLGYSTSTSLVYSGNSPLGSFVNTWLPAIMLGPLGINIAPSTTQLSIKGSGGNILDLFSSSGSKVVTVQNSGNVGIGTTNPQDLLSIGPQYSSGSALGVGHNSTMTYLPGDSYALANVGYVQGYVSGQISTSSLWNGTKNGNIWNGDSGAGNVGIGTTNPSSTLQVKGSGITSSNSGGAAVLRFDRTDGKIGALVAGSVGSAFYFDNSGYFAIAPATRSQIEGTVFPGTPYVFINSSGNVGIGGGTSPAASLDVEGANGFINANNTRLSALGGAGDVWVMADNNGNLFGTSTSAVQSAVMPGGTTGQTLVNSGGGWIATSSLFNNNGNIGIGTTLPIQKLEVNGNLLVTGKILGNNLVRNSSFEVPGVWSYNMSGSRVYMSGAYDGNFVAKGTGNLNVGSISQDNIIVKPSVDYTLSLEMMSDQNLSGDAFITFRLYDVNGSEITSSISGWIYNASYGYYSIATAGTSWTKFFHVISMPSNAYRMEIGLSMRGAVTYTLFDAVKLEEGDVATGYSGIGESSQSLNYPFVENGLVVDSGNVGIGITAPSAPLEVSTTGGGNLRLASFGVPLSNSAHVYTEVVSSNGTKRMAAQFGETNGGVLNITTNATPGTFGTPYISVYYNGNVGISAATPGAKLDVNGTFRSASANISGFTNSAGVVMSDNSGNLYTSVPTAGGGGTTLPGGASGQTLRNNGTGWVADSNLYNNGTNVGIGTNNPTTKLDVNGDIKFNHDGTHASVLSYVDSGYKGMKIVPYNGEVDFGISATSNTKLNIWNAGTNYFYLQQGSTASVISNYSTNPLALQVNGGKVGIGTTAPVAKLDVNGDAYIYNTTPNTDTTLSIRAATNGYDPVLQFIEDSNVKRWTFRDDETTGNMLIRSANETNNVMTLKVTGNVGIGTTAPGTLLDVNGSFRSASANISGFSGSAGTVMSDASGNLYTQAGSSGVPTASTLGQTLYSNGSSWVAATSPLYNNGTNIGIGTTNPLEKLDVSGEIRASNSAGRAVIQTGATNQFVLKDNSNSYRTYFDLSNSAYTNIYNTGNKNLVLQAGTSGNVGIGTTAPVSLLEVNGPSSSFDGLYHYKNLAAINGSGSITGTLEIVMPQGWSNTMGVTTINGYNYSGFGAWQVVVGGYNYTGGSWVNTYADIKGIAPFSKVRLGYNGTHVVILLGDTSTVWNYPKIEVSDFIAGHINYNNWGSGWSMSFITSESGISAINTPSIYTYINSSGNVGIGTTNPGAKLDVNGSLQTVSEKISGFANSAGTVMSDASGNLYTQAGSSGVPSASILGQTLYSNGTSWVAATSPLYNNGTNIGIGTTAPATKLAVNGDINFSAINVGRGDVYVENNSYDNQDGSGLTLRASSNPTYGAIFSVRSSGQADRLFIGQNFSSSGYNDFYVGSSNSTVATDTSLYAIKLSRSGSYFANGNVGIGTTNPGGTLTIAGPSGEPSLTNGASAIMSVYGSNATELDMTSSTASPYAFSLQVRNVPNSPYNNRSFPLALNPLGGNVGIAATSTGATLDVNGSFRSSSANISGFNGSAGVVMSDASGNLYTSSGSSVGVGTGTSGQTLRNNGTSWISDSNLFNDGTNVGIGTTNPGYKLDVNGGFNYNISGGTRYFRDNGSSGVALLQTSSTGWAMSYGFLDTNSTMIGGYGYDRNSSYYYIGPNYSSPYIAIANATGNVGIGTTNPSNKLYVNGGASINGNAGISGVLSINASAAAGSTNIPILHLSTASGSTTWSIGGDGTSYSNFMIWAPDKGVGSYLNINKTSGNVGINATSTGATLDVNGSFRSASANISGFSGASGVVMSDASGNLYTSAGSSVGVGTGTSGQTLRNDGTGWVANSALYNNGTNIGIGTTNPQASLQVGGGLILHNTSVADANYTATTSDYIIAYTSLTSSRTVTLPTALCTPGRFFVVVDESGNASASKQIIIAPQAPATIVGQAAFALTNPYNSVYVFCGNNNWYVL